MAIWGPSAVDRGNSKCKHIGVGVCWACSKNARRSLQLEWSGRGKIRSQCG